MMLCGWEGNRGLAGSNDNLPPSSGGEEGGVSHLMCIVMLK